ncbi:MAG: SAM-dependent methyltransferase [Acidobacteria bacterium]|nr:SAM-dependent methyltransferase [Acidobacteriota bacterium]
MTTLSSSRRANLALILLFVCSGCSALIYELVWFQLLELFIGASTVSLGILLGMFMGGMCLGSLATPRLVSRRHHPLRVYALMELGIGLLGLLLLFAMPTVSNMYTAWAGPTALGLLFRGVVAGVCLLPPASLMGATLPVISRWMETTPRGVSWLGFFYGGNIAGAVMGSLVAGFYLLRFHDVATATYVALAINLAVALLSIAMAKALPYAQADAQANVLPSALDDSPAQGAWTVYVTIALSGVTALASEVIWTRLLSHIFGATVYAFSLILAVFLLGLGLGASVGSARAGKLAHPRLALGWCQLLLCAAMAWTAYQLAVSLPYWPIDSALSADPWRQMRFDLLRALWAVLPPAIFWGASFPLALASLAGITSRQQDPGRWVGRLYGANTVGAIMGSLATSLLLVAWMGTQRSQQMLIAVSAISGLLMLTPLAGAGDTPSRKYSAVAILLAIVGSALLIASVPETPRDLIAYGRRVNAPSNSEIIYAAEGLAASVAVSRTVSPDTGEEVLNYHSAGKIQASSEWQDMRLQRILGHLTTLLPENARSFLVIGCGAGITAGAVSIEPQLVRETIVEIEPLVPKVVSQYFSQHNFNVIEQPKVHVRIDDGRHFLLTTKETFDGITSDPFDPWVKGTAALYTKEFFEQARRRLNPGGVLTQFVQLYETNEETVKSQIATFFEVFPNGIVFANTLQGRGYDVVLLGQAESSTPGAINVDRIEARLDTPEYARVAKSLEEIGFYSAADLLSTYIGNAGDLRPWLSDAVINRDSNLRMQYLAGMGLNLQQESAIYNHMTAFGPRFDPQVFRGSDSLIEYLRRAIESGSSR